MISKQLEALRETQSFAVFAAFVREGAVRRWIKASLKLSDRKFTAALVDLDNRRAEFLPAKIDDLAPRTSGTLRAICEFVKVQLRKRHPAALRAAILSEEAISKPSSARDPRARPVRHCARESRALRLSPRGFEIASEDAAPTATELPSLRLRLPLPPPFKVIEKISPSRLDDYLRCPFTAYLHEKTVLGPRLWDPQATALARWEFGNVVHAALEAFGESEVRASSDAAEIAAYLSARVEAHLTARFGASVPATVAAQGLEAKRRLADFAAVQAARRAAGWRIAAVERRLEIDCPFVRADGSSAVTKLYGKCDRIDVNERTGDWLVIDYKTWDRASELPASLQLPLYCAMLAADAEAPFAAATAERIGASYCVLGDAEEGCVFTVPDAFETNASTGNGRLATERAMRRAGEAVARLERGLFWPPSPKCLWRREYATWFSPSPEETVDENWLADQRRRLMDGVASSKQENDVSSLHTNDKFDTLHKNNGPLAQSVRAGDS